MNRSGRFCVNVLRSFHSELPRIFTLKQKGEDRFRTGDWQQALDGLPFLADAQANLFCEVDRSIGYGTHTIFIGRVYSAKIQEQIDPLLYHDGRYSVAGPAPTAPIKAPIAAMSAGPAQPEKVHAK